MRTYSIAYKLSLLNVFVICKLYFLLDNFFSKKIKAFYYKFGQWAKKLSQYCKQ